jgi:catechol 2,3-dioxygenase-like lactoylglutathione lyase family enzyme
MLGRFLEYSIITGDVQASLDFYVKLGFSAAEVGEAWPHPYAVVTDGRICLGLHQEPSPSPLITFVKPDLRKHLHEFERIGVEFEFCRLGDDVFNEVAWLDPSGHLIRLVEARTFSPSKRPATQTSLCGYFVEIALPAPNIEAAKAYWELFGFVGMDEPDASIPHVSCTSDTIDVGLYELKELAHPALIFDAEDVAARMEQMAQLGVQPSDELCRPRQRAPAPIFTAPEGTQLLLASADS